MDAAAKSVVEKVRAAVESDPRFRDRFEIPEEGLHRENDFWFVPARLQVYEPLRRRIELYVVFAELESYLQSHEGLKVVLLPDYDPEKVVVAA